MTLSLAILTLVLCCSWSLAASVPSRTASTFDLTLIHINDIHSHFEEISGNNARCKGDGSSECFGGQARLLTKLKELRDSDSDNENILFLNAGDYYQGTIWYSKFKYRAVIDFANMLGYDAMSIGNHDFDDGVNGLRPFLEQANFKMLAANIKHDGVEGMENCKKSVVVEKGGHHIGLIGYIISSTPNISSPGNNLEFLDEIESVRSEAIRLKMEEDVDIIIALGHSGYELDKKMAEEVPELDVIVGGHSHTFLWDMEEAGPVPSNDIPAGPYPTYIRNRISSKMVPVVQASCYGKYLGYLQLHFDHQGELLEPVKGKGITDARPILIDHTIMEDHWVLEKIERYKEQMTEYAEELGESTVDLKTSWKEESNLGNMITDALYEYWPTKLAKKVDLAFINNGAIRSGIEKGDIIMEDVWNSLPFGNQAKRVAMKGKDVLQVLEYYASSLCPQMAVCSSGKFLQMSGAHVHYVIESNNQGARVKMFKLKCGEFNLEWCPMEDDTEYSVAMNEYLLKQFQFILGMNLLAEDGGKQVDIVAEYIKHVKVVNTTVEGRIILDYVPDASTAMLGSRGRI